MVNTNPNTIPMQTTWDNVYQVQHHKLPVYPAISNFRLASGLKKGDTAKRTYRSTHYAYPMGGDGSYVRQPIVDAEESLSINHVSESSFYVKDLDKLQTHLPLVAKHAYDSTAAVVNGHDAKVLGKWDQFTSTIDAADFSGTAGQGIQVNSSNVELLFSRALNKLQRQNIRISEMVGRFTGVRKEDLNTERGVAILSSDVYTALLESQGGREDAFGANVGINGHMGRYFGFDLFVSNALSHTAILDYAAATPTAGDTVTINAVVFTFQTTLGTTAGNVHAVTDGDTSYQNLVNAINDSESLAAFNGGAGASTVGTDYVELTLANRSLLLNITATIDTTGNTVTLKSDGYGYITVSDTAAAGGTAWQTTTQSQHCLFGVNNAIDVVIQKEPSMKVQPRSGFVGDDVVVWAAAGYKVFHESLVKMVNVEVRTDGYTT